MAKLQVHPLVLIVNVFGILVWFIALGGLGAASYQCQRTNAYVFCAKTYQWEWWSLMFEAGLLLAMLCCCFLEAAYARGRIALLAFFVLATQSCQWAAHEFITQITLGPINVRDIDQDAVNAAAGGFVLLSLANFVLIIMLGKDFGYTPAPAYSQAHSGGHGYPGAQFQTSAPV